MGHSCSSQAEKRTCWTYTTWDMLQALYKEAGNELVQVSCPRNSSCPLREYITCSKGNKGRSRYQGWRHLIDLEYISLLALQAFLGQAIDPPSIASMDRAITTLEELGAIDSAGSLTALGKHMVSLVCSIFYSPSLTPTYLFHSQCFLWTSGLPR